MPSFWKGFGQEFGESFGDTFRQARADRLRREERDEDRAYREEQDKRQRERAAKAKRDRMIAAIGAATPEARERYADTAQQPIPFVGTQREGVMQTALTQDTGVEAPPLWQQTPEWQAEQDAIRMDIAERQLGKAEADIGREEDLLELRQYASAEADEKEIIKLAATYGRQGLSKKEAFDRIDRGYEGLVNPAIMRKAEAQFEASAHGTAGLDAKTLLEMDLQDAELAGKTPIITKGKDGFSVASSNTWEEYAKELTEAGRGYLLKNPMTRRRFELGVRARELLDRDENAKFIKRIAESEVLGEIRKQEAQMKTDDINAAKEIFRVSERMRRPADSMAKRRDLMYKWMHDSHEVEEGVAHMVKSRPSAITGVNFTERQFDLAMAMMLNMDTERVLNSNASDDKKIAAYDRIIAMSYRDVGEGPLMDDGRPKYVIVPEQIDIVDSATGQRSKTVGAKYFIHPNYRPSTDEIRELNDLVNEKDEVAPPMKLDDGTEIDVKRN